MTTRIVTAREQYEMLAPWRSVTARRKTAAELAQEYADNLSAEFHDWGRKRGVYPVGFKRGEPIDYSKPMGGPLCYWENIEPFLKERYPAVSRPDYWWGKEDIGAVLDGRQPRHGSSQPYETGPEAVAKYGYDPRQVAAGMMLLHTQSHASSAGNAFRGKDIPRDIGRLNDIFDKRQQMQQQYEQRQPVARRITAATMAYLVRVAAAVTPAVVNGLRTDFDVWWEDRGHRQSRPRHDDLYSYFQGEPPLHDWRNVENFLKENYPAAHRGLRTGFEGAQQLLEPGQKRRPHEPKDPWQDPSLEGAEPYETGPHAMADYGYDPAEVAASMLLLHNEAHSGRDNPGWRDADIERLTDIAQKRHQMQQQYEQRTAVVRAMLAAKGFDPDEVTKRLHNEFYDWQDQQPEDRYNDHQWNLGIGHWPMVEDFLKDKYPAAHRGFRCGREDASCFLEGHDDSPTYADEWDEEDNYTPKEDREPPEPYGVSHQTRKQLGYDPEEVVAGMLLLHNKAHGARGGFLDQDKSRLVDIFNKRQQMQRNYEQRSAV